MKSRLLAAVGLGATVALALSACGGGGGSSSSGGDALTAKGPIKIWYSNNAQEVEWGKQAVDAWNADHPDEKVTAQEIPAGKSSEEVITAAISGGTAPCLIYNTAPAAVADFQKIGGLVNLSEFPDGASYIEARSGDAADQFQSADGDYYQMPWKSNPVVMFYNKDMFTAAGLDPENPKLSTYADFLATAKQLVSSKAAPYAVYPSPASDFYQPWFDFYPMFGAQSDGEQLLKDGKATFTDEAGMDVANFWAELYKEGLAGKETSTDDLFATQQMAIAFAGPWAVANYEGKVNWGTAPVPTKDGMDPADTHTFDDAKNVGMYTACKNQGTAWEFLKFTTSQEQDGTFLELTGQMPIRTDLAGTYADFFTENPQYATWSEGKTVAVPNTLNSVEIWQTFRDAWVASVISGDKDIKTAFDEAATKINELAGS